MKLKLLVVAILTSIRIYSQEYYNGAYEETVWFLEWKTTRTGIVYNPFEILVTEDGKILIEDDEGLKVGFIQSVGKDDTILISLHTEINWKCDAKILFTDEYIVLCARTHQFDLAYTKIFFNTKYDTSNWGEFTE